MALGWENEGSNKNIVSLKLVAPQGPTEEFPKFFVKQKNEATGKYEITDTSYGKISGVVKSIRTSHNGKTGKQEVKGFVVCMEDGDDRYYIDATMTNASKDIANHVLANIGERLEISLYLNKNQYPTASVKEGGDFATTHMDFKGLDKDALWDAIKAQEDEVKQAPSEGSDVIEDEDLPF